LHQPLFALTVRKPQTQPRSTPENKASELFNIAEGLYERFRESGVLSDLEQSISSYRKGSFYFLQQMSVGCPYWVGSLLYCMRDLLDMAVLRTSTSRFVSTEKLSRCFQQPNLIKLILLLASVKRFSRDLSMQVRLRRR
jgi:hypothetical protein